MKVGFFKLFWAVEKKVDCVQEKLANENSPADSWLEAVVGFRQDQ